MWNCGCRKKMKASADFWVEYIKKLTKLMSAHQRRKGRGLWGDRQRADIWWMCYCWIDKSVSIENKCWVTVVSPGNSQDRCTLSPESAQKFQLQHFAVKHFWVRFQFEAFPERDLCFWSRNRSFYVTNGSNSIWIVSMMWSDTKNNNPSLSVAKTSTFGVISYTPTCANIKPRFKENWNSSLKQS